MGTVVDGYTPSLIPPATIPRKTSKMAPKRQQTSMDDPLTRAIAPPPDETSEERDLRIAAELEAERVSDAIDDELNRQRIADEKNPKPVKILLLGALSAPLLTPPNSTTIPPSSLAGQSESGMSVPNILVIPTERPLHRKIYHTQE